MNGSLQIVSIGGASITLAAYPQTGTIARDMQAMVVELMDVPVPQGGGDLNGSANTASLLGQAGTAGTQISVPREIKFSSSIAGVTN